MTKRKQHVLVVGAGPYGCVVARVLQDHGIEVTVVDRRKHIAGNTHDVRQEDGKSFLHSYGPHSFHTDSEEIWEFLGKFTEWYNHRLYAKAIGADGRIYSVPFSFQTLYEVYGPDFRDKWERDKAAAHGDMSTLEGYASKTIGTRVFELLIKDYTEKQWRRPCSELPASIIKRLPMRANWNPLWFEDKYQGLPLNGYTAMFEIMLGEANVILETEYSPKSSDFSGFDHVFYSGPLDAFFNCDMGVLDYRSLIFEHKTEVEQNCPILNSCTHDDKHTRSAQWSHFYGLDHGGITTFQIPADYSDTGVPYYPIRDHENTDIARKYLLRVPDKFTFGGRLATYQYYDMHHVIGQALKHAGNFLRSQ